MRGSGEGMREGPLSESTSPSLVEGQSVKQKALTGADTHAHTQHSHSGIVLGSEGERVNCTCPTCAHKHSHPGDRSFGPMCGWDQSFSVSTLVNGETGTCREKNV